MNNYYVISAQMMPKVLEDVLIAQELLRSGKVKNISEAVKIAGISRGTYYRYKDMVFSFQAEAQRRKAIINMTIRDEKGLLSSILAYIAKENCNILAINQTMPISHLCSVVLTLDIEDLSDSMDSFLSNLSLMENVDDVQLVSIG